MASRGHRSKRGMETLESSRVCRLCGQHSGISINIFDESENHVRKINAVLPIMVRHCAFSLSLSLLLSFSSLPRSLSAFVPAFVRTYVCSFLRALSSSSSSFCSSSPFLRNAPLSRIPSPIAEGARPRASLACTLVLAQQRRAHPPPSLLPSTSLRNARPVLFISYVLRALSSDSFSLSLSLRPFPPVRRFSFRLHLFRRKSTTK